MYLKNRDAPNAVPGKTYSLYGGLAGTARYYQTIRNLADLCLEDAADEKELLFIIQRQGKGRGILRPRLRGTAERRVFERCLEKLKSSLSEYTPGVKDHLKGLSLLQRCDPVLRTREYRYHLYMLEIELVNRVYKDVFKSCDCKVALFPHCLRDFHPGCRAAAGEIEHICQGCREGCYINLGSKLLKKYHIKPYISVTMDQETLFRELKDRYNSLGMLGVACVPELARGMRLCISLDIPAVGIPLDANRCARWLGQAHESSFNLQELENLVR